MNAESVNTRQTPTWLRVILGVLCVVLGLWLILRPVASLSVLVILIAAGLIVTGFARVFDRDAGTAARILGGVWVALGVAVLFWPGLTVRTLTFLVGMYLIVDGIGDIVDSIRAKTDQRVASFIMGLATIVFGVLALTWPDITILIIAVVFAARLIIFGVGRIVSVFRDENTGPAEPPGRLRHWARVGWSVIALLFAGVLALVSSQLNSGTPVVDEFYAAPSEVPSEPGALLRSEPFERGIPDGAKAWRILYTTTRDEGQPALASAIVVIPETSSDPLPVIAWAHGTTGVDETCAPSVLEGTFSTGAFFSVDEVVEQGWALVATDYTGLGTEGPHPYLIGQGEGRSVLDSVRAARQMPDIDLEERTIVWGHSQGGHAALWTGVLAPTYAPDVNVQGVAALAPASDLVSLVEVLPGIPGGTIFAAFVASAYSDIYDDVVLSQYVRPGGEVTIDGIAGRCLAEPSVFTSLLSALAVNFSIFTGDLTSGPMGERLAENIPPYSIEAPLLLGQGAADSLVKPAAQDVYVEGMCAAGRQVDYREYEGLDHVPLVEADSPLIPELIEWTRSRLAGEEPISTCA